MKFKLSFFLLLLMGALSPTLQADQPFPRLEEKILYSNKGSRSEARHHYLVLDHHDIPDVYSLVYQEGQVYRFLQREHPWGDDGYFPVPEKLEIAQSSHSISDQEIMRKYYTGKKRKAGTPDHWLYVEWKDGAAFMDAVVVQEFAEEKKLPTIPRALLPDFKIDQG